MHSQSSNPEAIADRRRARAYLTCIFVSALVAVVIPVGAAWIQVH